MSRTGISTALAVTMAIGRVSAGDANAERAAVAVVDLEGSGLETQDAKTLTEALRVELVRTGKFRVLERNQMNEILKEQGFQQTGACDEDACLVEMGQLLGVKDLVGGTIGKIGKTYSINVRLISVATGEIRKACSHTFTGSLEGFLTGEMAVVAVKLAGTYRGEGTRRRRAIGFVTAGVALAAGGAAAAVVLLGRQDEDGDAQTPTTGELELSW